jgi:hypothetical protein
MLRSSQKHRGVPIMPAGVHAVCDRAAMFDVILLVHRERVHVGAQTDRPISGPPAKHADDAGHPNPAMHFDAPGLKLCGHDVAGPALFEADFGMRMEVTPPGPHLIVQFGNLGENIHLPVLESWGRWRKTIAASAVCQQMTTYVI